jgi:hypothetical protein
VLVGAMLPLPTHILKAISRGCCGPGSKTLLVPVLWRAALDYQRAGAS